ncbi:MAG: hypothetical protein DKT66_06875 [Candidatus Melainabacteria bacterium]|nr:MAG: hypothetical protein DKT66_06875 [Candidatus Melainabacteria bacterium]
MTAFKLGRREWLASAFLAILAFSSFSPTLFAGFISDDGQQYTYIYNYLRSKPWMLLQNFTSCWMQDPLWGLHYRPMMLIPLVFDVLVWNQNTIGWHITCLLIHCSCTVLTFLLARKLLANLASFDGLSIPFFAAAIFATHPLHAESVAWICGRVDSVCTFFYLTAFVLFLHSLNSENEGSKTARVLSLCAFAAALLSKEVGVTIPAVLAWYTVCSKLQILPWAKAIVFSLKETRLYWLVLVVYIIVRSIALGTLYGGYHGFSSMVLDSVWLTGLLSPRLLQGIFLPISSAQSADLDSVSRTLIGLYVALAMVAVARFAIIRDWKILRTVLFLSGWLLMAFAIVARVWYAAGDLPGGRHFYLVSVPLCILATLLIVPAVTNNSAEKKLQKCAIGIASVFCVLFSALSFKSSELWVEANNYEDALERRIAELAAKHPTADRLVFLNPASTFEHLPLYPTFVNLQGCLMPPLFPPDLHNRIATLRANIFNVDLVNKSDLELNLKSPNTLVFGFDGDKREVCLVPSDYYSNVDQAQSRASTDVNLQPETKTSDVVVFSLKPAETVKKGALDCVEVVASCVITNSSSAKEPSLFLSWTGSAEERRSGVLSEYRTQEGARSLWRVDATDALASSLGCYIEADGKPHKYRFHLSEISSWVLFGKLSDLQLTVSPANTEIMSVRFLNLENEIPKLHASPGKWNRHQNGTLVPKSNESLVLNFDASKIGGASHVMAEISHPFEYYEYFNSTYRQDAMSPRSLKKYALDGLKGEMELWRDDFAVAGEYDVRVAAVDKDGKVVGYVSDPVTLSIR